MFLTSTATLWIIGVLYGIAVVVCYLKETREARARQAEREERRQRQNREWREQFNVLSPTVRAAIRLVREDRRETVAVMALLEHYRCKRLPKRKDKVDWKQEGF